MIFKQIVWISSILSDQLSQQKKYKFQILNHKKIKSYPQEIVINCLGDSFGPKWRHRFIMEYEDTYRGQRIIITTLQQPDGDWKSKAELLDSGNRVPHEMTSDERYPSEEEAKRAALSIASDAIDRTRISKGKP
jgi:hypothetical protein